MQLIDYLNLTGTTFEQMAERMKEAGARASSPSVIERHAKGKRWPSIETIDFYVAVTDGAVRFEDWSELRKRVADAAGIQSATETTA